MKLEEAIRQGKFLNEWHKLSVNLTFTNHFFKEKLQDFFKRYGITMQQFNVLRILRGQFPNPVSTCDIRERLIEKMSDTSRIVDRLCKEQLVTKQINETDKRLIDVMVTEKGLALLQKIDQDFPSLLYPYQNLTPEEATELNRLLDKLRG
jgi:DNA-binding MarR family transcriptional regulator